MSKASSFSSSSPPLFRFNPPPPARAQAKVKAASEKVPLRTMKENEQLLREKILGSIGGGPFQLLRAFRKMHRGRGTVRRDEVLPVWVGVQVSLTSPPLRTMPTTAGVTGRQENTIGLGWRSAPCLFDGDTWTAFFRAGFVLHNAASGQRYRG